ncbi:MAG: hypothetical protein SO442_09880, partial [Prevotella sp.]|nr:hypothetical protein [Prevotella sp.]
MNLTLRTITVSLSMLAVWGGYAQVPQSGTYRIKSANNTYVKIQGKYYAKPDATEAEASEVGVGIGYKTGDGYRVYSLTGTNPTNNEQIEVYDYVGRAYDMVSKFAQKELNKKLSNYDGVLQALLSDPAKVEEVKTALDAMADSICKIYTDDYAYMTLVPQAHYGNKWIVRAKATVPAIPYTIQAVGNYVVKGSVVREGHACSDVWDWAKQHVLKYLDEHQTDQRLKDMATKYLDQVTPGTTYYLKYDEADNSFGYETTPSDNGLWTMEEVNPEPDGLTPGVVNIMNKSTKHYVSVAGKYDAEPSMTLSDIESSEANKQSAAITLDFGRLNRSKTNFYRITELSNQGQDVVGYMSKGMEKVFSVLDAKLSTKDDNGKTYYDKIADLFTDKGIANITAENVRADVKTAVDLCADHYAYMKLIDNGDGSVSLRVDMPQVPALLDLAVQMLKNDQTATFEDFAKDQISKYFESSETTESLKKLWNQNKDKWHFGHNYYLSAESSYKTFEFTEDASDAAAKWTLAEVNSTSNTNPYQGYYRIKNVGGYNDQQYIDVRGRITADATATNEDKVTKPGTVLYVNLNAKGTDVSSPYVANSTVKGFELLNLRSQGLDVMNGAEATEDELKKMYSFDLGDLPASLRSAYSGYVGFGRYMLAAGATFADGYIKNYASDTKKFDALMTDFNDNYLPYLKFQVYLLPVEGKKNTYLVRSQVPSLKPIVDFYKANKTDMDKVVVPAVRSFLNAHPELTSMVGFTGEKFTDADDATINSWYSTPTGEWHVKNCCEKDAQGHLIKDAEGNYTLSYSTILGSEQIMFDWLKLQMLKALKATGRDETLGGYVNMIHYNTPYYLIEGDNHNAQGGRGYTANAELGFANDGLNANMTAGTSDLDKAAEHAYWTLEPVDADNYFTVKPNSHEGKNHKYYSSTYLDFPFQITGSNVSAVYAVNNSGVQNGKKADGTEYKYVTFDKVSGVVPAATPVIIEFNQSTVDNTLALIPVLSDARTTVSSGALVQGTFLGGKHNLSNPGLTDGSLQQKWGVGTDGKDLYLWGYNTKDTSNPYGFYLYSKKDEPEDSQYNLIPANKPFLVLPQGNNAKVYVMFGDGEATSINSLFDATTTMPADA